MKLEERVKKLEEKVEVIERKLDLLIELLSNENEDIGNYIPDNILLKLTERGKLGS